MSSLRLWLIQIKRSWTENERAVKEKYFDP